MKRRNRGLIHMLDRLQLRFSTSRRIDGLWIGALLEESEAAPALCRVEGALHLIKSHDRIRYNRLLRDLDRVWVCRLFGPRASYRHSLRACQLDTRFVVAETSSERIASSIVHEATHARLMRCGIGYEDELRARVEAVCLRREIAFAAKLPNGRQPREDAEDALGWYAERGYLTDAAVDERRLKALFEEGRNSGAPEWLMQWMLRTARALRALHRGMARFTKGLRRGLRCGARRAGS